MDNFRLVTAAENLDELLVIVELPQHKFVGQLR